MSSKRKGILFIVSAPSGCGKTTMCARLLKETPDLVRSISVTTRQPRKDEKEGVDYYFVSPAKFQSLQKRKEFAEHAKVFGKFYGTPIGPIKKALKNNKDVLLSIDVQGASQIKNAFGKQCVSIFILPPSFEALKQRLVSRRADTKREIEKRLKVAKKELACLSSYDYAVVNHNLTKAVLQLKAIVMAERNRVK